MDKLNNKLVAALRHLHDTKVEAEMEGYECPQHIQEQYRAALEKRLSRRQTSRQTATAATVTSLLKRLVPIPFLATACFLLVFVVFRMSRKEFVAENPLTRIYANVPPGFTSFDVDVRRNTAEQTRSELRHLTNLYVRANLPVQNIEIWLGPFPLSGLLTNTPLIHSPSLSARTLGFEVRGQMKDGKQLTATGLLDITAQQNTPVEIDHWSLTSKVYRTSLAMTLKFPDGTVQSIYARPVEPKVP